MQASNVSGSQQSAGPDDLSAPYAALEWFQEEFRNGRFPECTGKFVALVGREVLATGRDVRTVTEAALLAPNVTTDQLLVTYAGQPQD